MTRLEYRSQQLLSLARERVPWMLDELRTLVEFESPTGDKERIEALARYLGEQLRGLGFTTEYLPGDESHAAVLRAEFGTGQEQVLLLSHLDTVWPVGTVAARPFRVVDDRAYGPGTADMKGGIVVAFAALQLLMRTGVELDHRIVWLLTPDEEVGSPFSRPVIEAEAQRSRRVLVTEPGDAETGGVKTVRKGSGVFDLRVRGIASHSGAAHAQGASAISEMARLIEKIDSLTDYQAGVTTNVGVVGGGSARNVVADSAWAKVDLRVSDAESAASLETTILNLEPVDDRVSLDVEGGISRPPMVRTPAVGALYQLANDLAADLGFELPEVSSGGASDANFTAAMGVPTLDGLGAVGDGMHGLGEYIDVASLAERAALLAQLIAAPVELGDNHG